MAKRERMFQPGLRGLDTNLLVVLSFIMIFGFVMIYSASYYTAGLSKAYNYDPMYLLKNQIVYTVLGVIAMLVVASVNYHIWSAFVIPGICTVYRINSASENTSWSYGKGSNPVDSSGGHSVPGSRADKAHYDCLYGHIDRDERTAFEELAVHDQDYDSQRNYCGADLENQ